MKKIIILLIILLSGCVCTIKPIKYKDRVNNNENNINDIRVEICRW